MGKLYVRIGKDGVVRVAGTAVTVRGFRQVTWEETPDDETREAKGKAVVNGIFAVLKQADEAKNAASELQRGMKWH